MQNTLKLVYADFQKATGSSVSWENASCFANPVWLFNSSSDTGIFHVYYTMQGLQKDSADSIFP